MLDSSTTGATVSDAHLTSLGKNGLALDSIMLAFVAAAWTEDEVLRSLREKVALLAKFEFLDKITTVIPQKRTSGVLD